MERSIPKKLAFPARNAGKKLIEEHGEINPEKKLNEEYGEIDSRKKLLFSAITQERKLNEEYGKINPEKSLLSCPQRRKEAK